MKDLQIGDTVRYWPPYTFEDLRYPYAPNRVETRVIQNEEDLKWAQDLVETREAEMAMAVKE